MSKYPDVLLLSLCKSSAGLDRQVRTRVVPAIAIDQVLLLQCSSSPRQDTGRTPECARLFEPPRSRPMDAMYISVSTRISNTTLRYVYLGMLAYRLHRLGQAKTKIVISTDTDDAGWGRYWQGHRARVARCRTTLPPRRDRGGI